MSNIEITTIDMGGGKNVVIIEVGDLQIVGMGMTVDECIAELEKAVEEEEVRRGLKGRE